MRGVRSGVGFLFPYGCKLSLHLVLKGCPFLHEDACLASLLHIDHPYLGKSFWTWYSDPISM